MNPALLGWRVESTPETVSTGIPEADAILQGCPRGRITEIVGPPSSGRTSLLYSILAEATHRGEVCALVDTNDTFDPSSAAAAGVELKKLIWIRCSGNPEHAMRAVDLVIQSGGFGVVALDLADVKPNVARRIPISSWYRFRRAIESTPTILVLIERESYAKSCASLLVEMRQAQAAFTGAFPFQLLRDVEFGLIPRKPVRSETTVFRAQATG